MHIMLEFDVSISFYFHSNFVKFDDVLMHNLAF